MHLILKGTSIARPSQTVGCSVGVKVKIISLFFSKHRYVYYVNFLTNLIIYLTQHISYGSASSSSNSIKGDAQSDFFVELWDVSGHERYKDCRFLFYTQIDGKSFLSHCDNCPSELVTQCWIRLSCSGKSVLDIVSGMLLLPSYSHHYLHPQKQQG